MVPLGKKYDAASSSVKYRSTDKPVASNSLAPPTISRSFPGTYFVLNRPTREALFASLSLTEL